MTSENIDKNLDDPKLIAAKTITFGALIIGTFLSIFVIWGVIAPINSASIAQGQVVLDFNKKTIQHLEGGIIEDILVKEGQYVVTNQPLIYLQDIQSRSQNKMLRKQLVTALAIEARLIAERDNSNPDFTKILEGYNTGYISENNEINKIISTQANLYQIRQTTLTSKKDILEKRIDQLSDEIAGITSQLQATDEELKLLKKQERMSQKLVKNNNSPLNKLIEIQKQIAAAKGKKGELEANIAKAKQTISETELEIINLVNENLNDIIAELQDIEVKVSDLTEELVSAKDVLKRTMIKSPTSGIVTDLKYHTIGAVISPANEIMYIVPKDDQLIIEARINPNDIDNMTSSIEEVVFSTEKRNILIEKGFLQNKKFSWNRCAIETLKAYNSVF